MTMEAVGGGGGGGGVVPPARQGSRQISASQVGGAEAGKAAFATGPSRMGPSFRVGQAKARSGSDDDVGLLSGAEGGTAPPDKDHAGHGGFVALAPAELQAAVQDTTQQ